MEKTIKLHALPFNEVRTYLFATLFIAGNILLPQLCHLVPQGGLMLLPIYFFTLVAAYKYGLTVGLLTAIGSPLANHLLFGMPPAGVLPLILVKSVLLAFAAAYMAKRTRQVSLLGLAAVVLAYQVVGSLVEWAVVQDFRTAMQDFRIGVPGMLVQVLGGFGLLKAIAKK